MTAPPGIVWTVDAVAGVTLQRATARVGPIEVGTVLYDGSNGFWVWSSPLADDAWGWGPSAEAAERGLEAWLRRWLAHFRPFLDGTPPLGATAPDGDRPTTPHPPETRR